MINSFDDIKNLIKDKKSKSIAVSVADDTSIKAISLVQEFFNLKAFLTGNKDVIEKIIKDNNIKISNYEIIHSLDDNESALNAVKLVSSNKADMLLKGSIKTSSFLKTVLNEEFGLRSGKLLSHLFVGELKDEKRLIYITDGGMNIEPTDEEKISIMKNAIEVAKKLHVEKPKIALLSAVEVFNEKMKSTVSAVNIKKEFENEKDFIVEGPLALDLCISKSACLKKNYNGNILGDCDIYLCPNIDSGNILGKSLIYFAKIKSAGLIAGTKKPVLMLSRSDEDDVKINSILLGIYLS